MLIFFSNNGINKFKKIECGMVELALLVMRDMIQRLNVVNSVNVARSIYSKDLDLIKITMTRRGLTLC